jgi:hypothetical protein
MFVVEGIPAVYETLAGESSPFSGLLTIIAYTYRNRKKFRTATETTLLKFCIAQT